jgi:hypothetical protein
VPILAGLICGTWISRRPEPPVTKTLAVGSILPRR